jgi:hypothetical protein
MHLRPLGVATKNDTYIARIKRALEFRIAIRAPIGCAIEQCWASQFRQAVIAAGVARPMLETLDELGSTLAMDFRAKLKIAGGKRLAKRGATIPPPIGTWERVGWDEWHSAIVWDRCEREQRESQAHITTGYFTPLRSSRFGAAPWRVAVSPIWKIVAVLSLCTTLYLAGRYVLLWL